MTSPKGGESDAHAQNFFFDFFTRIDSIGLENMTPV